MANLRICTAFRDKTYEDKINALITKLGYTHSSINIEDKSGARDNHGDRVIADALCFKGLQISELNKVKRGENPQKEAYNTNSIYGRRMERKAQEKRKPGYWDSSKKELEYWN